MNKKTGEVQKRQLVDKGKTLKKKSKLRKRQLADGMEKVSEKSVMQRRVPFDKGTGVRQSRKRHRQKFSIMHYRIGRVLTYATVFLGISAVCLFLSSTILFGIKEIIVQGDEIYAPQIVIEQSAVKIGDNLFLLDTESVSRRIAALLPEVDEVSIHKKFPSKLVIDIKHAIKAFDVEVDGNFVSVSSKGKILSFSDVHDESLILLQGTALESYDVGSQVAFVDKTMASKISDIIGQMAAHNLEKITGIDFSSNSNLVVNYDNRIKINFGFYENMDYKIRTAAEIIKKNLSLSEAGILDLSEISKENRSYFIPEY